jgi:signal peptidase I
LELKLSPLLIREIVGVVAFTVVIIGMFQLAAQAYEVSGGNGMEPGLANNQRIMVNKTAYWFHSLERGDVIAFHNPQSPNDNLIKRIIGLPRDTVKTDSSHVWVNNVLLKEPYINAPPNTPLNPVANTWHVPPDQYFVLGDNRPLSYDDSRYIGFIPKDYIVGKVAYVFWPVNSIHSIDPHSDVFSHIKNV